MEGCGGMWRVWRVVWRGVEGWEREWGGKYEVYEVCRGREVWGETYHTLPLWQDLARPARSLFPSGKEKVSQDVPMSPMRIKKNPRMAMRSPPNRLRTETGGKSGPNIRKVVETSADQQSARDDQRQRANHQTPDR